ncbi:MAG: hypothetical protein WB586_08685 [Chthoniobacterales bacterium]
MERSLCPGSWSHSSALTRKSFKPADFNLRAFQIFPVTRKSLPSWTLVQQHLGLAKPWVRLSYDDALFYRRSQKAQEKELESDRQLEQ